MSLRISLLSVNEVGELGRITNEEDWGVVVHPVPNTLLCLDLHRETTGITSSVRRSALSTDSAESYCGRSLLANGCEKGVGCDVRQVVCNFKVTVSTSTLGMNNTLRDSLSIEVGEEVNVVEICQKWSIWPRRTLELE